MKGRVAVMTQANQPLEIREYPVPPVEPGGLLIKVRQANFCGSDLHFWRGAVLQLGSPLPIVLGHEVVGTVVALGKGVKTDHLGEKLEEGDRIVYSYFKPCGHCWACLSHTGACPYRNRDWIGASAEDPPHFHGAYGEYHYLHPGHWVFKVPPELPDPVVSPVNCALSEMVYGLHQVGVTLGDTVVIQGAGGLGLYGTALAKAMGAGQVVILDRLPKRLELAQQFGADHSLDIEATSLEERRKFLQEITQGRGADLVVEVTGSPLALPEGISLLRPGGKYLMIGNITVGKTVEVEPAQIVRGAKTLYGVIAYEAWAIPRALQFLQSYRETYPFDKIVSHLFPFERINEALALAASGEAIRVGIHFD